MKVGTTTRYMILCSFVVVLVGLPAGQAKEDNRTIEFLSDSFGIVQGQKARVSLILQRLANPHLPNDPVNARIQLLDEDGDVIAQSDELRIVPGQTRFWDQPRALLPASREPGGRVQVRVRMMVTTKSADIDRPLMPTIEVIDTLTGATVYHMGKTFLIFASTPGPDDLN